MDTSQLSTPDAGIQIEEGFPPEEVRHDPDRAFTFLLRPPLSPRLKAGLTTGGQREQMRVGRDPCPEPAETLKISVD